MIWGGMENPWEINVDSNGNRILKVVYVGDGAGADMCLTFQLNLDTLGLGSGKLNRWLNAE